MFGKTKERLKAERQRRELFAWFIRDRKVQSGNVSLKEEKDPDSGVTHKLIIRDKNNEIDEEIEFKKVKRPTSDLFVFELDDEDVRNLGRNLEKSIDASRIPERIQAVLDILEGVELKEELHD